jgi:hypothetical protein
MGLNPIVIAKSYALSLTTAQNPGVLVQAARDIQANGTVYTLSDAESDPVMVQFMSPAALAALLAGVNPSDSLAPMVNYIAYPMQVVAVRMEEFYRVITGISEFAGTDPNGAALNDTPIQIKIKLEGRVELNQVETHTAASGGVVASYPIGDTTLVSATKPGGTLTVETIATPNLGVIPLHDGVSPVADGVVVSLAYPTVRHCVVQLLNPDQSIAAVAVSQELVTYLTSNA